jgi:nicotinate-nucleotide pyrophosphorylase (carboxylating)
MVTKEIKRIIKSALKEDIGTKDVTTSLAIPGDLKGQAVIIAKQDCILCGVEIAKEVFSQVDCKLTFKPFKKDGTRLKNNDKVAYISGDLAAILAAERVALNFLYMLSAVATLTKKFIDKTKGLRVKILDTRKTTPNLRSLEKYAVRVGGGSNHRSSLSSAILVKDNHLKAGGYVYKGRLNEKKICLLIDRLRKKTSLKIEIEVENLNEFKGVIKYRPDIIMLDNFSLKDLKVAVKFRNKNFPQVKLEASGGVNLRNVRAIARCGPDFISAGMLTHSPQAVDFSLEIV